MTNLKTRISVILILFCVVLSAYTQDKRAKHKEMRTEMHAYATANVLPILKEQRSKLEAQLSEAEKATLADVRERLHEKRDIMHAERKKMHEQREAGTEIDRKAMHEKRKAMHAEMEEIIAPAKVILENHKASIEQLLADERVDKETWKADMENIRRKYVSDEEIEERKKKHQAKREQMREAHKGEHQRGAKMEGDKHHHRKGKGGKRGHGIQRMLQPLGFLLWDGTNPEAPMDKQEETEEVGFGIYPNPSNAQNTVEYHVSKRGNVKVELLDKQGNVLKTVVNETKKAGEYAVAVDLNNLPNAVYYYRITTKLGSQTKRFVLNK